MKKMKVADVLFLMIPLLVGVISSLLTKDMILEYGALNKPSLAPPSYIFPIAWTVLYLLMGVSSLIILKSINSEYRIVGLILHFVQLIFNFFWSIIFFNMQNYYLSFGWLIILFALTVAMVISYRKVDIAAAILNIPYLLWLVFAGYLNLAVGILN